ncbi:related to norsolorinic acid reductase [Phialocephala subalpina]|uniref:Related to norsolorinic acid reductase n=1 Tax=Phialocephala subalpina TaxID=576137 RepID=A0A1L7WIK0_9HELO|nr:related to norsolorinic acid reductase [Phialocephala subalpina]
MAFLSSTEKPNSLLRYHRILSPTCAVKVSPLCLGSMNFGEAWKAQMGECNKETSFSILDHFYEMGGNFIDTANVYMTGESEQWLGEWMQLRGVRDQMVIATKYTSTTKYMALEPPGIYSNYGGESKKSLRISLEKSLKSLQTEYVDILYVHAWEGLASIPEIMRALDDVVRAGKVLYLGISNWPAWLVVKANDYARQHGLTPFVVYEGRWNPANREIERDVLPMCKAEGMAITVWSSLGSGKFRVTTEEGARPWGGSLGQAPVEVYQKFGVAMEKIGKTKGSDATAVALRYCMLKAPYVFPIVGGRKLEHLQKNIEALAINLSEEEIKEIEAAVPFDFGYPHSFLSGDPYKNISSEDPTCFIRTYGYFDGVQEPKAIHSHE